MYAVTVSCLIAAATLVAQGKVDFRLPISAQAGGQAVTAEIAVKQAPPQWLALREYVGPYWRIGPTLAEVQSYMAEHRRTGPIAVRYDKAPPGSITRSPRAAVGFVVDEGYTTDDPYRIVRAETMLVAYMAIEGRQGPTQRDYIRIREWALARGYEPTGQITELYAITAPEQSGGSVRTEIQAAVVPRVPPPREVMATRGDQHRPHAEPHSAPNREAGERTSPTAPPAPELQITCPVEPASDSAIPSITSENDVTKTGRAARRETSEATILPDPNMLTQGETRSSGSLQPVRELIASGRFDHLAQQLMPDNRVILPLDQLWLGQLVFRIGAVARGVEQVHPGQAGKLEALAEALTNRYKSVFAELKHAPLDEVVVRLDSRDARIAIHKRGIMTDVDRLLAKIAFRTITADSSVDEIIGILDRVQELLQQVRPITSEIPASDHK